MPKLKTLNDIKQYEMCCSSGLGYFTKDLKKEMRKHISFNNILLEKNKQCITEIEKLNCVRLLAVNSWIKHVFNLEEEDE